MISSAFRPLAIILPVLLAACIARAAEPLRKFENCTFVPTDWADGDSFRVRLSDGKEQTIRLYGVDCIELHVSTDSDARRLRAQRRYFGITQAAPDAAASIELAKSYGSKAGEMTAALLAKPFTIHTRFRDALGDGKHKRIYAFVDCANGTDLAAELVKAGLARAHGVYADGPGERSAGEYEKALDDLELQAAKRGAGVWAKTNWDKLPAERSEQRRDEADAHLAIAGPALTPGQKLNPNTAARDDLMKLDGIGEEMANRIIEGRPYAKLDDLLNVPGIGPKTLGKIAPSLAIPAGGK